MEDETFKRILEAEKKADEKLMDARKKATEIEREAEMKSAETYDETCKKIVEDAKRKADEIIRRATEEGTAEAKRIIGESEQTLAQVRASIRANHRKAVRSVVDMMISGV